MLRFVRRLTLDDGERSARPRARFVILQFVGGAAFLLAGLSFFGVRVAPVAATALGVLLLSLAKFVKPPAAVETRAGDSPALARRRREALTRFLPTIMELARRADGALRAHERFEDEVGGSNRGAYRRWTLSALRVAAYWIPLSLLAMLAGAMAAAPLKLIAGGLGLAGTPEGQWLLKQSWPRLVGRIAALSVLEQVYLTGAFVGLEALLRRAGQKKNRAALASAALVGACFLAHLLWSGFTWMKAAPLLAIQWALMYCYARTRTLLAPGAANVALGLMSLYSARMVVLLTANLGSIDSLPGIPGLTGVLAILGAALALFAALAANDHWSDAGRNFLRAEARAQWERARSLGAWWSGTAEIPKSPLTLAPAGLLWGIAVYLAGYLTYYAVAALAPVGENMPAALKQVLLMPFDMLVYVFLIGAALEELIFRFGLFNALAGDARGKGGGPRFRFAVAGSAIVFSAFHFVDFGGIVRFLGLNVSTLVRSLMVVYGFSWPGFAGRVAAGIVLALLYRRSRVLLLPIIAHFTSNLLEAVGLRWGLAWFLAAVAGIFALQILERI
jgi:membrane protease YdiL (CAAX protease family)